MVISGPRAGGLWQPQAPPINGAARVIDWIPGAHGTTQTTVEAGEGQKEIQPAHVGFLPARAWIALSIRFQCGRRNGGPFRLSST